MKNFLLIFVLLSTLACSKQEKVDPKQNVTLTITREALSGAGDGGVMVWGRNPGKQRVMAIALPPGATSATFQLDTGLWDFAAMAWAGSGANELLEGATRCFARTGVDISGEQSSVNINLQTDCSDNDASNEANFSNIGSDPLQAGSLWTPLHIMTCVDFTDVTGATAPDNSACTDPQEGGNFRSYRIVMLIQPPEGGPPGPGLQSKCLNTTVSPLNDLVLDQSGGNPIRIPLGSGLFPIPTRIEAFTTTDCSGGPANFDFPDGIAFPGFGFDSFLHSSVDYTSTDRPLIILPGFAPTTGGGGGGGSSPLVDIIPNFTCTAEDYCGPSPGYPTGNFKYAITPIPSGGPPAFRLFMDAQDPSGGDCAAGTPGISGTSDLAIVSPGGDCQCSPGDGCWVDLVINNFPGDCSPGTDNCTYALMGTGNEANVTIQTQPIMFASELGEALLETRNFILDIVGGPDGAKTALFHRFDKKNFAANNSPNNFGLMGKIKEILGPGQIGNIIGSQGFTSCDDLGDPNFNNTFPITFTPPGGPQVTGSAITDFGVTAIPNSLFPNTGVNTFEKRINLNLITGANGDNLFQNFAFEFNCPGNTYGDKTGAIHARNFFDQGDPIIFTREERLSLFYNLNSQTTRKIQVAKVIIEYDHVAGVELRKTWQLGSLESSNANTDYMRGNFTKVEKFREGGPGGPIRYKQLRTAYTYNKSSTRFQIAHENHPPAGSYFNDNDTSGLTSNSSRTCINSNTLLKISAPGADCAGASGVEGLITDGAGQVPMVPAALARSGNMSMDYVGKPDACGIGSESSVLECDMDDILAGLGI